jgi:hypothetical protein
VYEKALLWRRNESMAIFFLRPQILVPFMRFQLLPVPAKFGSNWPRFRRRSLKCEKFTDDGRQVMAIVHLDLWSRQSFCFLFQSDIQHGCQGQ